MAWTRPFKAAWGASLGVGVVRYPAGQMRLYGAFCLPCVSLTASTRNKAPAVFG